MIHPKLICRGSKVVPETYIKDLVPGQFIYTKENHLCVVTHQHTDEREALVYDYTTKKEDQHYHYIGAFTTCKLAKVSLHHTPYRSWIDEDLDWKSEEVVKSDFTELVSLEPLTNDRAKLVGELTPGEFFYTRERELCVFCRHANDRHMAYNFGLGTGVWFSDHIGNCYAKTVTAAWVTIYHSLA